MRKQRSVAGDDAADGGLRHRGDLHGRRRGLGLLVLLLAAGGEEKERDGEECRSLGDMVQKCPRECLEIADGQAVAHHTVIVRVAGLDQGGLRIHQFEDGSFAGLVAQRVQAQALGGQVDRAAQQVDLLASGLGFVVEAVQISNQVRCVALRSTWACFCLSSAWRTLLRRTPQSQTGMFRLASTM